MAKTRIHENRRAVEARKKGRAKTDFSKAGQLQSKLDVIAEYLGLIDQEASEQSGDD